MKKSVYIIVLLLFIGFKAIGQAPPPDGGASANGADKNFHFGLNVTPGAFWLNATAPSTNNGTSIGFGYGVNLEFYFSQNYGFVTGVEMMNFKANYTNTTSGNTNPLKDSSTAHQIGMQYLEIPLLLKFRTLPIGLMKYFGVVGFDPGIRIGANDNYTVTNTSTGKSYSENNVNASNYTDIMRLAYVIGLGAEYNIAGTTSLQGFLSYDSSFLNLASGAGNGNVKSTGITLTLGVLF